MTELGIYKFVHENNIEWHPHENNGKQDVLIFPPFYLLDKFVETVGSYYFDEDGLEVIMKDGYVAIWMNELFDYHGIEIDKVFKIPTP